VTSDLRIAFDPVAEAFDALRIEYRIGGSVASAALGVSRSTLDIDVVAEIPDSAAPALVARLASAYYIHLDEILDAIRRHRSFNLIHFATMVKIDVFVLGPRPYDQCAFERRASVPIAGEIDRVFPVTTAEDIVLRKLEWYEHGDRVSERQWQDVIGVLRVQRGNLDLAYMRQWAQELGVQRLLEDALSASDDVDPRRSDTGPTR
jgi:hypothetical protein